MTLRALSLLTVLSSVFVPAWLAAQETSGREDERLQALAARNAEEEERWFGPKNKVTIGFKILNSGGSVHFGNLGAVPAKVVAPTSVGVANRIYDDGTVFGDGPRANEIDTNGNQTSTPGGRYATYSSTVGVIQQTGDYLSYTPGQTRNWTETTDSQITEKPGYVAFSNYSTTSEGGSFTDKMGPTGGVELQFSRDIGRLSRRIQWGFATGIALNSINSKASGSVLATLNKQTDYYAVIGTATTEQLRQGGPTYNVFVNENGVSYATGLETTVPLSQLAQSSSLTTTAGGANVSGRWQVKGAYMMVKLGPSFRSQINDYFEISGSAGFAAAYVGTHYTATESFSLASLPNVTLGVTDPQSSSADKFVVGYYADLTLAWNANETTGIFGGLTAQQLDSYEQKVANRTAMVDLGSAVGVRGGISIRF